MTTIKDYHLPFRDEFQVASFRGAAFFCEADSKDNGRRVVVHEFPKQDQPFSEDMGRRAYSFTVRGYCVTAVRDAAPPYSHDYRTPRNQLISALDAAGAGMLILPTGLGGLQVMCTRYRVTEEDKLGGYCVFDMEFAEAGGQPNQMTNSGSATAATVSAMSASVRSTAIGGLNGALPAPSATQAASGAPQASATALSAGRVLPFQRPPLRISKYSGINHVSPRRT